MGFRLNPRNSSIISRFVVLSLLAVVFLVAPAICSQDIGADGIDQVVEAGGSIKDLGRRCKIVLEHLGKDAHSIHLGTKLDSGLGVFDACFASLCIILVSEIGDETFIIAALIAMRHLKSIVLSGALSALVVMTVLSTGLGRIVPNLISRKHTNSAATG